MLKGIEMKIWPKRRPKRIFVSLVSLILICLISIPNLSFAISFGAYPKISEINLGPDESGSFKILFYSRSEKSPQFYLSVEDYPKSFLITYPEKFSMDSEFLEDEYVLISGEYIKAKVIKIDVDVPEAAGRGEHIILLKVVSVDENIDAGSFMNVNAEKTFLLKVNVLGEVGRMKSVGGVDVESDVESYEESELENATPSVEETIEKSEEGTSGSEVPNRSEKTKRPFMGLFGLLDSMSENKILLAIIMITTVGSVVVVIYLIYKKMVVRGGKKEEDMESKLGWEELKKKWSK